MQLCGSYLSNNHTKKKKDRPHEEKGLDAAADRENEKTWIQIKENEKKKVGLRRQENKR